MQKSPCPARGTAAALWQNKDRDHGKHTQEKAQIGHALLRRPGIELAELLRQLSGMAVNINQIAKVANASGFIRMEDIAHIKTMQGLLWQAVKEL